MRTIKFRAKRVDNDEWVFGSLSMIDTNSQMIGLNKGDMFICNTQTTWKGTDDKKMCGNWIKVKPETVGQFVGFKDKNGYEIYEDDIVENFAIRDYVIFDNGVFATSMGARDKFSTKQPLFVHDKIEVMGNKFDNDALLGNNNGGFRE